jgi:hypothetical protein
MDQRGLVERARGGDHDAFAELARAAVVRLDRAARLILRDPELACDAVQEGLIRAGANWSPHGSKIAYWTRSNTDGLTAKSHIVNADGTADRELPGPPGAIWNAHATWSNDGKSLFIARGYTPGEDDVRGVVIPADGSSVGIEVAPAGSVETDCCAAWIWAPDDSKLLGRSAGALGGPLPPTIVDVAARTSRLAKWSTTSDPTWERLAP